MKWKILDHAREKEKEKRNKIHGEMKKKEERKQEKPPKMQAGTGKKERHSIFTRLTFIEMSFSWALCLSSAAISKSTLSSSSSLLSFSSSSSSPPFFLRSLRFFFSLIFLASTSYSSLPRSSLGSWDWRRALNLRERNTETRRRETRGRKKNKTVDKTESGKMRTRRWRDFQFKIAPGGSGKAQGTNAFNSLQHPSRIFRCVLVSL